MIGNPKWFTRRKYTGWGFSPKTWQGWVYIFAMVLPIIIITELKVVGTAQIVFILIWAIIFGYDFIYITTHLEKDERERIHEAIAERNALWAMLAGLVIGIGYQTASSIISYGSPKVDPVILIAVGAGLIAKIISNVYLDKKD